VHEFALPGDRRSFDSFEVWYGKERLNQRPEVRLYGASW
jgi:hypothetical protein